MTEKNLNTKQSVHIILQEKGGIGKTYGSSLLLQYLISQGVSVVGIDTDPSNATLAGYKSLPVTQLNIMDGNSIDISCFDNLMVMIDESDNDYVIDIGSSNFIGFNDYVLSQDIYGMIESMGINVYLHIICVGGQANDQTLLGLQKIIAGGVPKKSVVPWENEHFGKLHETIPLMESSFVKKLGDKVYGGVFLKQENSNLLGKDLQLMQKKNYTFEDVKAADIFNFVQKSRLLKYQAEVWRQFAEVFSDTVEVA